MEEQLSNHLNNNINNNNNSSSSGMGWSVSVVVWFAR